MSFGWPAGLLLAVVALPILALWRRARAPRAVVPSLAFVPASRDPAPAPSRRPPLAAWLAAAAVFAAALALANPTYRRAPEEPVALRSADAAVNVGLVGWVPATSGEPARVIVLNAGAATARRTLRDGESTIELRLVPEESRAVALAAAAAWRSVRLEAPAGERDAFALDDALERPPSGISLDVHPDAPEPLRRALVAAAGATAGLRVEVRPLAPRGSGPAVEFAIDGFRRRAVAAVAGTVGAEIALPAELVSRTVEVDEPWIVDRETGEALVGREDGIGRLGLDVRDPALARSPALPVLTAALLDAVARGSLVPIGVAAPGSATAPDGSRIARGSIVRQVGLYRGERGDALFAAALLDPRATLRARETEREVPRAGPSSKGAPSIATALAAAAACLSAAGAACAFGAPRSRVMTPA
ncbi:MAG TPA: hypothetical protein VKE69_11395 [Planctomycetota bacterium]|nr:hypothetical protein [Planctomycetota bacterium]